MNPSRVLLAVLVVSVATPAMGQSSNELKVKCANAYEQAQRTRNEGLFLASRQHLLICADDLCPPVLRNECVKWLGEVDSAMPSVVIVAKDAAGNEVSDVTVVVDGTKVLDHLDGKALPVDPGVHLFKFKREGSHTVEQKVLIREAEKRRPVAVTFGATKDDTPEDKPTPTPSSPSSVPTATYILAGVGVVALGISVPMYIGYFDKKSRLDDCAGSCKQDDVDAAKRQLVGANIATWIGVAAIGTGIIVWAAAPKSNVSASVAPLPGGVAGSFAVRF
jgi:hypothetical protein